MKIAFLAPTQKWSIYYVFLEYKRFLEQMYDVSVDVIRSRAIRPKLRDYDLIVGAVKWQYNYTNDVFKRLRDRFIGLVTGFQARTRVADWSLFKYLWFWSDYYVDKRFENNTYFVEPFGVDHNFYKPMEVEKTHFAGFVGNASWPKKRVRTIFVPACKKAEVTYRIVDGRHSKWVPVEEMPKVYNSFRCYFCSSVVEAGPAPVLEAASCGIPIIAPPTGFAAMFKRTGAFLCSSLDEYVHALELLKDEDTCWRLGREARFEILERWTWPRRIPILVEKIEKLGVTEIPMK